MKLREEEDNDAYFIYYERPDEEIKMSNYECYSINDVNQFYKTFGHMMNVELIVEKTRELYIYKNAQIHIDNVKHLGVFMEIEVVIKTEDEEKNAQNLLHEILEMTNTKNNKIVIDGYRELMLEQLNEQKDYNYYVNNQQLYWVVNKDINGDIKANDIVPCIFTERKNNTHNILQLDYSIFRNNAKYTMWRKMVGKKYNFTCDVLLITKNGLIDLQGNAIDWKNVGRSKIYVHRSYLARFE
jgi:predicted adenylyl cyclase CyaB